MQGSFRCTNCTYRSCESVCRECCASDRCERLTAPHSCPSQPCTSSSRSHRTSVFFPYLLHNLSILIQRFMCLRSLIFNYYGIRITESRVDAKYNVHHKWNRESNPNLARTANERGASEDEQSTSCSTVSSFSFAHYMLSLISHLLDAHLTQFQSENKRKVMYVSQRETVRERLLQSIARRASETSDSALSDTRRGTCESDRHSTSL